MIPVEPLPRTEQKRPALSLASKRLAMAGEFTQDSPETTRTVRTEAGLASPSTTDKAVCREVEIVIGDLHLSTDGAWARKEEEK
jgi:hypothetical protein